MSMNEKLVWERGRKIRKDVRGIGRKKKTEETLVSSCVGKSREGGRGE